MQKRQKDDRSLLQTDILQWDICHLMIGHLWGLLLLLVVFIGGVGGEGDIDAHVEVATRTSKGSQIIKQFLRKKVIWIQKSEIIKRPEELWHNILISFTFFLNVVLIFLPFALVMLFISVSIESQDESMIKMNGTHGKISTGFQV